MAMTAARQVTGAALAVLALGWVAAAEAAAEEATQIGSRRELFVDTQLVAEMRGAELRLHEPRPAFSSNGPAGHYMTVIHDGERYQAYFRAVAPDYDGPRYDGHPGERTRYLESQDGIHWVAPDLGGGDERGYANALAIEPPFTHNFSPFLDTRTGVAPERRYKALAGVQSGGGLYAFHSADGIRWSRSERPAQTSGGFDSQNIAFWSEAEGRYVSYVRAAGNDPRSIDRLVSDDFESWRSDPLEPPNLDGQEHLYTNQAHPYFRAPHLIVALPTRFTHGYLSGEPVAGNVGSTDILFMSQRAGSDRFDRTFPEAFLRPGRDEAAWGNRANYLGLNVVPTADGRMSLYHIDGRRFVLRLDGFASVWGPYAGGELISAPIRFSGSGLYLNVSTAIRGGVRVELQTAEGEPIPGFALADCETIIGDALDRRVAWAGGPDLSVLAGRAIRARFELRDADVFSYQFR